MQGPQGARDSRYKWLVANIIPYEGRVRRWLHRMAPSLSPSDTDDVIQEAYTRIWQRVDIERIEDAHSYFRATVRNLVTAHAQRARIVPMERLEEIEALKIPLAPDAERTVSARQQLERVHKIVESLPRQCRRVMIQKLWGFSTSEIAEQLSVSVHTVQKHSARGLGLIVQEMGDIGLNDRASANETGPDAKARTDYREDH
jgi:RNA polymerase sigma factor (sigma-70 family)